MTPVKSRHWDKPHPGDTNALDGLLLLAGTDEPTEHEIARLRRSVRTEIARTTARPAISRHTRVLALACSLTVGIAALWMISSESFNPARHPSVAAVGPKIAKVARLEDGSVAFEVAGARQVRVTDSAKPAENGRETVAEVAADGRFVDTNREQAPGTVVFYRFD